MNLIYREHIFKIFFFLIFFIAFLTKAFSQDTAALAVPIQFDEFKMGFEFRPRTEFRNGYRELRNDTTSPALFTNQRSRLYLTYQRPGFIFHTSLQDIRIWGEDDPRSTGRAIQIFEAYVEPTLLKNISVRIGRQKIMYDNQRLFAQNDWRQNGGAHDAVRFMYYKPKLETDLISAFNQSQERFFETTFTPAGFTNYKILVAHFLKYKLSDKLILTTINVMDAFQDTKNLRNNNYRFTSGGRVEYIKEKLYLTAASYYQYGETPTGQELSAYYYQPEIKYAFIKPLTFHLGAEVFSGDDGTEKNSVSHSFDALYGVNHRFLGSMDFFIRFPADFNIAGIIAPYFFTFYDLTKKIILRADEHLFFSQNNFVQEGNVIDKYLGFENDLLLIYRPIKSTEVQLGFSYALLTDSMEIIKKKGNSDLLHTWGYLMITFKPELLNVKKEIKGT